MKKSDKPSIRPDFDSKGYWEAAKQHDLALRRCRDCGAFIHPPRAYCYHCLGDNHEWARLSGRGTIYSFTLVNRTVVPGFEGEIPYVVAAIELIEAQGVRIISNIVDCDPKEVGIGMPVEVTFEDRADGTSVPLFRLASS